jgi:hypothetical protein
MVNEPISRGECGVSPTLSKSVFIFAIFLYNRSRGGELGCGSSAIRHDERVNIANKAMERGLLWLPLLAFFIGLAWVGWKEYQKVEAYQVWAQQFDHAKYDLYAVLGQTGDTLTWGIATSKGVVRLETFSLGQVEEIRMLVNDQPITEPIPRKGKAVLEFIRRDGLATLSIPFTEPPLAHQWQQHLRKKLPNSLT